jgi:hypothetical protein
MKFKEDFSGDSPIVDRQRDNIESFEVPTTEFSQNVHSWYTWHYYKISMTRLGMMDDSYSALTIRFIRSALCNIS